MDGRKHFTHLLDDEEQLIKVFKPNKKAIRFTNMFPAIFMVIFFTFFFAIAGFTVVAFADDGIGAVVAGVLGVAVFIVGIIIASKAVKKSYENLWYAYTDKKLIIRRGVFSTSYSILELKLVGSITVGESYIDKRINKNTGSLSFSSPSMPVVNQNTKKFEFSHIEDPYKVYKDLTKIMEEAKNDKN